MYKERLKMEKIKCKECGNTDRFACRASVTCTAVFTWCDEIKSYREEAVDLDEIYDRFDYECSVCGNWIEDF
jgi:hypothetical protein